MREQSLPITKTEIVSLDELLRDVERGRVQIPQFQRPFVWGPNDVLMLFDSIDKGYPIGSIVLWKTDARLPVNSQLGPLALPPLSDETTSYLLDGQQRLAVLYGVLRLPSDFPADIHENHWMWWVFYDLRERRFVHFRNRAQRKPWHMPMRAVSKTVDFLREMRAIQQSFADDEAAPLIEEADALALRIKTYRMTLTYIHGGGLNDVTEISSRLNHAGESPSATDALSAAVRRAAAGGSRTRRPKPG